MISFKIFSILIFISFNQGFANGQNRIIGGNETSIEKYPYQACLLYINILITDNFLPHCGASIISTKHLLSAAQCDPGLSLNTLYARVGSDTYNSEGQVLKIGAFIVHPNYDMYTLDNDLAIVTFSFGYEIELGSKVAIIPLSDSFNPDIGSYGIVTGWGIAKEQGVNSSEYLRVAEIQVVDDVICLNEYPEMSSRQMCMGGTTQENIGTCYGDTGGPVVQDGVQFGIVSSGNSCDKPNTPEVYTRISAMRSWIKCVSGL